MKRTALIRKTPMRTKRKAKPKALKDYHGSIALMPCEVCGMWPVEVHHVRWDGYQSITRNHKLVIALCHLHHRTGPLAVHVLGNQPFEFLHSVSQHAIAVANWERFNG